MLLRDLHNSFSELGIKQHRQPYQRAQLILSEFPSECLCILKVPSLYISIFRPSLMRARSSAYSKRVYIHHEC